MCEDVLMYLRFSASIMMCLSCVFTSWLITSVLSIIAGPNQKILWSRLSSEYYFALRIATACCPRRAASLTHVSQQTADGALSQAGLSRTGRGELRVSFPLV